MSRHRIYSTWAPAGSKWARWVKPVVFSGMSVFEEPAAQLGQMDIELPDLGPQTAVVVDLPGAQGVSVGLELARRGYRPAPLYNACPAGPGQRCTVEVQPIAEALAAGAAILGAIRLSDDAPPAFLLDADRNRAAASPLPGVFDNRSISLPTDFPSGTFLLSENIRKVVLIGQGSPATDLSHTLLRWQEAGIAICLSGAPNTPIVVERPARFRMLCYNLLAIFGLRRSPLGGFGGTLPMPSGG